MRSFARNRYILSFERNRFRAISAALLFFGFACAPAWAAGTVGVPKLPLFAPLAPDTVLHSLGGTMSALLFAAIGAEAYPETTLRSYPLFLPALALSAALTAGIAKEALDSTGFGDPQWSDILHTLLGGVVGAAFVAAAELVYDHRSAASQNEGALFAAAGISLAVPVGAAFVGEILHYLRKRRSTT